MAEEASKELESDTILNRKAEEAKPRQEAAVKGVRPSQPAPTSVPRAERKAAGEKESSGGLIGFIKKLFGAKEEAKPVEKRQAGNREGRNGDRNRNNRNRNNRNRNKNEAGRDTTNSEEKSDNKEARQPNQRNGRNQQRQNKPEANQEAKAEQAKDLLTHTEVPQAAEGSEGDERRRGRNRRGRNRGRDRAERGENNTEATTEVSASTDTTANAVAAPTAVVAVNQTVETSYAPAAVESSAPVSTPAVVVDSAPAVTSAPAEVAAPVVAPAPAPLPKVEFKPLQTSELTSVIESAGMVWVNTDNQKLEEVRAQIAAEPAIVHPPREPKPPVEISTGPMVLVETGGKEQTIQK
jgi:ribonuclease E